MINRDSPLRRPVVWVAALGMLAGVYDLNAIAVVLVHLRHAWDLSAWEVSWLAAAPLAGMIFGALLAGLLADRFGRRWLLVADFASFLVAAIFSALAQDYLSLILWRLVMGVGIGADFAIVFPYLAEEIAPASRGAVMALVMWIGDLGQLLAYLIGGLLVDKGANGFRYVLGFGALLAVATLLSRRSLHESRAWQRHRLPTLSAIFHRLRQRREVRTFMASGTLWFLHQVSGQGLTLYLPLLLALSWGLSASTSGLLSLVIKLLSIGAGFMTIWLIDRWGRRPLQAMGFLGRGVFLLALALIFMLGAHTSPLLGMALLAPALAFGAMGPDKTTVITTSERLSTEVRASGQGLAEIIGRMGGLIGILVFGWLSAIHLTSMGLLVYAVVALLGGVLTLRWLPETRRSTLMHTPFHREAEARSKSS